MIKRKLAFFYVHVKSGSLTNVYGPYLILTDKGNYMFINPDLELNY